MPKHFCASLLIIYLISSNILFALAGKPDTAQEVRLYHQVKQTIDIELFVFDNQTGDEDFDYLTTTIPELIATQIEINKTVMVSSNNMKAEPIGYSSAYDYKTLTYTNITYITNYNDNELTVTTNNEYITVTNSMSKKDNINITDAYSLPLTISSDEELYMYNGEGVILKDNSNFVRTANVYNSFQKYSGTNMAQYAFTRNADIVIYGDVQKTRYTTILNVYIAEINAKTVTSYAIEIDDVELEQISQVFALEIANQMNSIEKTGVINIEAKPEDSLLYLDGIYIGKVSDKGIQIPSITVGEHRITVEKENYQTIDEVFAFAKPKQDINLQFSLMPVTNLGRIMIEVDGGSDTKVIFNGLIQPEGNTVQKDVVPGEYSLKMTRSGYKDYYASVVLNDLGEYSISPELEEIPELTLARRIFGNYERNTKIGIGLSLAAGLFTAGAFIYANEIYDKSVMDHVGQYGDDYNKYDLDLTKYNTANNLYIGGLVTTSILTVATGVFYLLWINESNFKVHNIILDGNEKSDAITFNIAIHDGATVYLSKRF